MSDRFTREENERLAGEVRKLQQDAHRLLRLVLLNVSTLARHTSSSSSAASPYTPSAGSGDNQFCVLYRDLRSTTRLSLTQIIRQLSALVSSVEGWLAG
jgi:hypothetical protein